MNSSSNINPFVAERKMKRNVIFLSYSVGWGSLTPTIIGYYKNIVSPMDLAYRLITDIDILEKEKYLYRQLILINHDRLRGHERLGYLSEKMKSGQVVDLKLADIVRLYTERMDPWAIISDIGSIKGHKSYQLCYEDGALWKQIMSVHFDQCSGWVEAPLSPSEGSPLNSPRSPSIGSPRSPPINFPRSPPINSPRSPSISPPINFPRSPPINSPRSPSISPPISPPANCILMSGCTRQEMISTKIRRHRFQCPSYPMSSSSNLSNSVDISVEDSEKINQGFDYDHEDKNGCSVFFLKRTPTEERELKILLDLELDWLSKGKQDFDPVTPEGKRKIAMGWQPIP